VTKSNDGIVEKIRRAKQWTDWVDYSAVDYDYLQRKEIIQVPVGSGLGGGVSLPRFGSPQGELPPRPPRTSGKASARARTAISN
jgi:hypothetical protein